MKLMKGGEACICRACSKAFSAYKGSKGWFCSRPCHKKTTWRLVTIPCAHCEKPITKQRSRAIRFCSVSCGRLAQPPRARKYTGRSAASGCRAGSAAEIYGGACEICGFYRALDYAHITPDSQGGTIHPSNIIALCPNHHRLFDRQQLSADEYSKIAEKVEIKRRLSSL